MTKLWERFLASFWVACSKATLSRPQCGPLGALSINLVCSQQPQSESPELNK